MGVMAVDKYGTHYDYLGKFPRKELLRILGASRCEKMYVDTKSGDTVHIGYIIADLWLTLYRVSPLESTKS